MVEGVGGLLVPLAPSGDVRELAVELGLAAGVVARPGLGTINHTLLTLEAARGGRTGGRRSGADAVAARARRDVRSNRETIAGCGEVEVATLGVVAEPLPAALAAAAAALPLARWLGVDSARFAAMRRALAMIGLSAWCSLARDRRQSGRGERLSAGAHRL